MGRKSVEINPECGKRLRLLIKENGTTQKQLADDIGVSEQTIYKIVNGKISLSDYMVEKILERYPNYCTDLWLLGKAEYKTPAEESTATKDIIRNKVNQIFQTQIERQERMLSVFAQLVSECGFHCEYDGDNAIIKTPIESKDSEIAFYDPVAFSVSQDEIDLLYSCFKSATETFLTKKGIDKIARDETIKGA